MAMSLPYTLLSFLGALAILITVHEYGHYRVAKLLGVRILRFSIGFGPVLCSRRAGADQTEFALSAIPLGGYVKMLDEREEEVDPTERHRAFNTRPLAYRAAIVAAGPFANFLLAVVAYWLMFLLGVVGPKPLVGDVIAGSPAQLAGMRAGDEILAVGERPTQIWDNVIASAVDAILDARQVEFLVRDTNGLERRVALDFARYSLDDLTRRDFFQKLGLSPKRIPIPPVIGEVVAGGPAAVAGLLPGDRIIRVEERDISDWFEWVAAVRAHPDQPFAIEIQRAENRLRMAITPRGEDDAGQRVGKVGAGGLPYEALERVPMATERYGFFDALVQGVTRTVASTQTTLKFMARMVTGDASLKNLGGPVSIARVAGASAQLGVARFVEFLGLMSVSLAVLNLLPIPLLDGGHLMYYLIESIMQRPLPERVQLAGQQVGMVLLLGLMVIANYNDLMPYLARLF